MVTKPKLVLVGGPDVDARLPLMRLLADDYEVSACGAAPELESTFAAQGFGYTAYPLNRRVDPLADLRTARSLRAAFRRLQPDIVHTFDTKPGVFGCTAARRAGVPIVLGTVTGLGSLYVSTGVKTRLLRWIYQRLQKRACRHADLTIFQNHDDARQLVAAGVVPIDKTTIILGSGVPTAEFEQSRVSAAQRAQLRAELGLPAAATVVTMIARVTRTKGVLEFMAAAAAVRRHRPEVRFLLVGPADEDSLDRLTAAEMTDLQRAVTWPGRRRDIAAILAITDVFVLPSAYREGIPRVLLEGASMGLPLITTDSPGCNEVVVDGTNGFLMATGDVAALVRHVTRLVEEPALRQRFGAASRQRAVAMFDLGVIATQTNAVYRTLLQRRGRAAN